MRAPEAGLEFIGTSKGNARICSIVRVVTPSNYLRIIYKSVSPVLGGDVAIVSLTTSTPVFFVSKYTLMKPSS